MVEKDSSVQGVLGLITCRRNAPCIPTRVCQWYGLRTNQGEARGRTITSIMRRGEAGRDHVTHGTTVNALPPTADFSMCAPGVEESTSVGHARQHQKETSSAERSEERIVYT